MNPLIKDEINRLRSSPDPRDKAQATIIEMLCSQDETLAAIKEQTTKTNGRVTRAEGEISAMATRLTDLEKPVTIELGTLWKSGKSFAAVLVACAGLVAGVVGSVSSGGNHDPEALKAAVAAALAAEEKKEKPAEN